MVKKLQDREQKRDAALANSAGCSDTNVTRKPSDSILSSVKYPFSETATVQTAVHSQLFCTAFFIARTAGRQSVLSTGAVIWFWNSQ